MKRHKWTKQQDVEISESPWMTPDVMTWNLNRTFNTDRSVKAVACRQRKILGFIPKCSEDIY